MLVRRCTCALSSAANSVNNSFGESVEEACDVDADPQTMYNGYRRCFVDSACQCSFDFKGVLYN